MFSLPRPSGGPSLAGFLTCLARKPARLERGWGAASRVREGGESSSPSGVCVIKGKLVGIVGERAELVRASLD